MVMRILKGIFIFSLFCLVCMNSFAQKATPLPHGMVFGIKPSVVAPVPATQLESLMARKTRFNTAVSGKILKVTKPKGGWFLMDAGNGKTIKAHFKNYNVNLPAAIKGRTVIIQGVAQKQFIADDLQHFAGDTVKGKKQHTVYTDPKQRIDFEVRGLIIDK
jgi:hypothetical protein